MCNANPFRVYKSGYIYSQGWRLSDNPGLELANAFGVICNEPTPFGIDVVRSFQLTAFLKLNPRAELPLTHPRIRKL
jgi:hypothetical protein